MYAIDISERAMGSGAALASLRAVKSAIEMLQQIEIQNAALYSLDHMCVDSIGQPFSKNSSPNKINSSTNKDAQQPDCKEIKVGILTFSHQLHFYSENKGARASDPVKMYVVDPDDPFAALPACEWLFGVDRQHAFLEALLAKLPALMVSLQGAVDANGYLENSSGDDDFATCPTAAIKAVQLALEQRGGRLALLTSAHSGCGYGKVPHWREAILNYKNATELSLYGAAAVLPSATVNHAATTLTGTVTSAAAALVGGNNAKQTMQQSQQAELKTLCELYSDLAADCVRSVLSVSVYATLGESLHNAPFFDSALLAEPVTATGGRLHLLPGNMASEENAARLSRQLTSDVYHVRGSEAVMKLRTSIGIRTDKYIGEGCEL